MSLTQYLDLQPKVIKMLMNSYKKERLAHAYLFEGEKGTKKKEIAIELAKLLYCEDTGNVCDSCINCLRIEHLNHPNVILIEPDNNTVKKEQVLFLQQEYTKTNLEPGPKVYIIEDIDKMSTQAANSILKFIEEPLPDTYTIMTTNNIQQILPTIISRCQVLNFKPLPKSDITNYLISKGIDSYVAAICARLTNDLDDAYKIANDENITGIIEFVNQLSQAYLKRDKNLIVLLENNKIDLYKDKKVIEYFLDIFLMYMRDIQNVKEHNDDIIFYSDLDLIKAHVNKIPNDVIINNIDKILKTKIKLEFNANLVLLIDDLLINLK